MQEWMRRVRYDDLTDAHKRFADVIGVEKTLELCEAFGGTATYVPLNSAVYNAAVRDPEIVRLYLNGVKVAQIAARFSLAEQTIFTIVKGKRPGQIGMDI